MPLTLVGTIHRTQRGKRLRALLRQIGPDLLTLEMSPWALRWRLIKGPHLLDRLDAILAELAAETGRSRDKLRAHPEAAAIRTLLRLPFEYACAAAHADRHGIPLHLIDSSLISARKLRRVERELVTKDNLRVLLALAPSRDAGEESRARALLLRGTDEALRLAFLAPRRTPEGIGERDRRMAAALRRMERGKHLVHIGGWVHLVDDPKGKTLYSRLEDLAPERVLLE